MTGAVSQPGLLFSLPPSATFGLDQNNQGDGTEEKYNTARDIDLGAESMRRSAEFEHTHSGSFGDIETNPSATGVPESTSLLGSAHGPSRYSHLPTPQSPNNVMPYFPGVGSSPGSPLSHAPRPSFSGMLASATHPQPLRQRSRSPHAISRPSSSKLVQMATPESSPVAPLRRHSPVALTPRPRSAPFSSPSSSHIVRVKPESPPPSLAPAHIISPPMSSSSVSLSPETARSRFSSPFMTKLQLADQQSRSRPPSPGIVHAAPTTPIPRSRPMEPDDLFSPVRVHDRTPLSSLLEPTPLRNTGSPMHGESDRPPGGEIDRIRAHLLDVENTRVLDVEIRRPEYLRRSRRATEENGAPVDLASLGGPHDRDGLGIMVSPNKGRRLQLFDFKETSAESFEESLMTHGYGTYGEPRTPQRRISPADGLSQEAIDWLTYNTPAGPSIVKAPPSEAEVELSEKELKKRKRLEAFKGSTSGTPARLYPVQVEGKGRILLNVLTDEVEEVIVGTPSKKRAVGRKKKPAADKKGKAVARGGPGEVEEPKWLDKEFPWCLREKDRDEMAKAEEAERLRWIERFLDRDTDNDEDEEEEGTEEVLPSSAWGQVYEDPPLPSRKGRGKMVPLRADPATIEQQKPTEHQQSVFFPSDPADARAALLSKKSVRALAHRRQRVRQRKLRNVGTDDDVVRCICGDGDDGTPQVQCDDCHLWYHLDCIGIVDAKDLGDEDDPWFCFKCTSMEHSGHESSLEPPSPIHREPTFVPTEDRPPSTTRRDVAFYQSSPHASPQRDWSSSAPPQTPERGRELSRDLFSSQSVWGDSSRADPSTPYSSSRAVRVFTTPGGRFDDYEPEETSFDPTSTPSRGITLGMPFVTPKSNWAARASGLLLTPRNDGGGMNRNPFLPSNEETHGLGGQFRNIYSYDDTPIRRDSSGDASTAYTGRHLLESPLASRTTHMPFARLDESPVQRSKGKEKESGETNSMLSLDPSIIGRT